MGMPEPKFVAMRDNAHNGLYDWFMRYIVHIGLLLIFAACWWFYVSRVQSTMAHDPPRSPREPARYEITLFAGGGNACLGVKATTMKITTHTGEGGPLLRYRGTDGFEYTYHGPFLVKSLR